MAGFSPGLSLYRARFSPALRLPRQLYLLIWPLLKTGISGGAVFFEIDEMRRL
jgi:hypothetical protein